ncbi:UNVERIFIED_CONTAM: nuclease-related domain-containing protein [Campylobacter lari]
MTVLSLIIVFSIKNKRKNSIGFKFELMVKNKVLEYAKNNGLKFIEGGLYKYANNQFFEVDGILIGKKNVFIIESKYYLGTITGESSATQLNLKFNKKDKKIKNPLLQNFKHIQHFYKMCNFNSPVLSLLVLPDDTKMYLNQEEA